LILTEAFSLHGFLVQSFAVFLMLGILSVLIIVHECGHFSVARFFGFQTPVFGFGLPFGPHWVVGRKWNTEFRVHACLLGGYVAIPELGDETNASQDAFGIKLAPFRKFPIWQRALVAFAGVGFNILFAYLVMFTMLVTLGEPAAQPTYVQGLVEGNPGVKAGVQVGDQLVEVNHVKVNNVTDAVSKLVVHKHENVLLGLKRGAQMVELNVVTTPEGKVGMALENKGPVVYQKITGDVLSIAGLAFTKLWELTAGMIDALGNMVHGLFSAGKATGGKPSVGIGDLHGVLAVVVIGADFAKSDWSQLFLFTILISMDLAIVNLLPWPALDGGHLAFMLYEGLRGKPMEEKAQGEIVKWGFLSLIALMVVIMVNDVTALFTGKLARHNDRDRLPAAQEKKLAPAPSAETSGIEAPASTPAGK
jgi:membrane-associated protease RseP (regulator of RpoE activity)